MLQLLEEIYQGVVNAELPLLPFHSLPARSMLLPWVSESNPE